MKRVLLALLCVIPLAGIALWFFWSNGEVQPTSRAPTAPRSRPAPASKSTLPAPSTASVRHEEEEGDVLRYSIEFHNEFLSGDQAPSAQGDPGARGLLFGFSGFLSIAPVSHGEARWLQYRLSEITPLADSEGRSGLEGYEQRYLEEGLAQAFYVELEPRGAVRSIRLTRATDALIEGILRVIATGTQFVTPTAHEKRWRVEELDNVGRASVEYSELEPNTYQKKKLEYVRVLSENGLVPASEAGISILTRGVTTFEFDASHHFLRELELSEDTSTNLTARSPEAPRAGDLSSGELSNHVELALRYVKSLPSVDAPSALLRAVERAHASPLDRLPAIQAPDPKRALADRVGQRTLSELLADIDRLQPENELDRRQLLDSLEALLELDPASARATGAALRTAEGPAASTLMSALAGSQTPQAQHELRELANDRSVAEERRETAIALLGMSKAPSEETREFLSGESQNLERPEGKTAALALGNLADTLRGSKQGDALFEDLVRRVEQASSGSERALLLDALGNTGDPRLVSALARFLTSGESSVRSHAFWALRLVKAPEASTLIAKAALTDPDPEVRSRAVDALRYREAEESLPVLETVVSSDPDPSVREQARLLLGTG